MADILLALSRSIERWKLAFGTIYYIKLSNNEYIFRPLRKVEYVSALSLQTLGIDISDSLLAQCLLYPEYEESVFNDKLAGEVDSLVRCISYVSGFSDTENFSKALDAVRGTLGTLENQIAILICKAFPQLTPSDIDHLTYEDLLRYIAISESILDVKLNIEKPTPNKEGTIDFEKENRDVGEGLTSHVPPPTPRGEARKKT